MIARTWAGATRAADAHAYVDYLHATGSTYLMKYGAAGETVRRLQRALDAAYPGAVPVTGTFAGGTTTAVKRYQGGLGLARTGVVTAGLWDRLQAGKY